MKTKQLFYACAGILLLVVAYSIGANRTQAQAPNNTVVGVSDGVSANRGQIFVAITASGDWYWQDTGPAAWPNVPWQRGGSIFGTVGTNGPTWTGVKQDYRK